MSSMYLPVKSNMAQTCEIKHDILQYSGKRGGLGHQLCEKVQPLNVMVWKTTKPVSSVLCQQHRNWMRRTYSIFLVSYKEVAWLSILLFDNEF